MSVGGVRRGGKGSGPKGPSGTGRTPSGSTFKVGANEGVAAATAKAGVAGAAGPDAAEALKAIQSELGAIAAELRGGTLTSKSEATQRAVQMILEKKHLLGNLKGKSAKRLVEQIADTLQDDPRLAAALDRTWSRG